jgi:nicotinate-nucleotide--dimethylbenzimidazole phosphoribosyltransferase
MRDWAQARLDSLTKPVASLGRLEELARQVAAITGKECPVLHNKLVFTICADHGVVNEGTSAYPQKVTAQMVKNFAQGGAAINVLARQIDARVVVADFGVAGELCPNQLVVDAKMAHGTANMVAGPAMTREQAAGSIRRGVELFQKEHQSQRIDLAGIGDMGIGNTTSASAITATITRKPVNAVTGLGTGISQNQRNHKVNIISKAIALNKPDPSDPLDVLAKVGGFEIGGMTGVILAAAANRVPVVLDGFISGAAALIATTLEPISLEYMIASHKSAESGHQSILDHIGLEPLLDLDMRLGEGTGAVLGFHLVEAGVRILTQMATFSEAGVSPKE